MKVYIRIGTQKRLKDFKEIAIKFNLKWRSGKSICDYMPDINYYNKPFAIIIDTSLSTLSCATLAYFKSYDEYVQIKFNQLEMVLEELL